LAALQTSMSVPAAKQPIAELFRRFGADQWDALRARFLDAVTAQG